MGEKLRIELDRLAPLLNEWERWHWAKRRKYKKSVQTEIFAQIHKRKAPPMEKCVVIIERHSVGMPDWDNLFACAKGILDCLVVSTAKNPLGLGVIVDDNPMCILDLKVKPVKVAKRDQQKTVIFVEEVQTS